MEYQEFMELVPEETKIFVDSLLPYLSYYSDRELEYKEIISSNDTNKKLFLSLYVLSENPIYHNLLVQLDFDRSLYKINSKKIEEKNIIRQEVFHCMDDILTDNDPTVFRNLTPIDIVLVFLRKYQLDKTVSDRIFKYIFHDKIRADNLYNQLTKYSSQIKQNRIIQIENSIYNHVPNHIISYFETASKIYKVLFLSLNKDSEIYHKNANDIVSLSMLLSLFYYQDVSLFPENSLTEKQIIESLFKLRKITAPSIMNKLSIQFNLSAIQSTPKDIFVIQDYLIRYYQDLVNQKNDESNIMVSEIVEKLFDHNYTNSFAIDKILTSFGFPIQYFSNLHEQVETEIKNQKQQLDMDFIHSFYKNLSHDTRVFIEFTAKTYQLLLEKMKTNTHNKELLSGEDDADTLALYIANCYFHGDVDRFFQMYGVTLQKVLELLNISISKEEIEKVQLNQKILVERFHRFVYEGINQSKTNITINDIVMNLCNRDFNQSMIMENVFESITEKMNLDIDFYHQLKEVFIQKELSRKEKVQQKLFQDMPRETINYLENVSKVHQALLCCKDININQKDIKVYSLLLGILYLQEDNISLFFRSLEFDSSKIYSYLSNKIKTYPLHFNQYEIDVDLLSNQYGMYIFGGKNQNKSRKELTIKAIASNIFNQELNNSISIAKFLNKFHHSYEEFEDFDSLYEKWQNTKRENDRLEAIKQSILKYNSIVSDYIFMVLRIHYMIKRELESGKIQQTLIQTDDDIERLSFLLALRIQNASSWQFFEQRGLTTEKILHQCGLRLDLLDNVAREFLDYDIFETNYQKYFVEDSRLLEPKNVTIPYLTKKIFDSSTNHSQILEKICTNLDIRYDILQLEVENDKPYEQILSIDQRIQLLSNEQVSHIDLSDITNILNFGNSLVIHSNYIHNELPKLVLSDTHDSAIQEMNHMIENAYSIESLEDSKKSFWSKIFHTQENQESQMVFDSEKIKKIQQTIEQNIETLSKEIVGYDNIRKYIEIYRQKNNTHFLIAQEAEKKIQEKLQNIDPEQDNQYSEFLVTNSQLQMIHNKVNRFATTNQLMRQELLSINQTIVNHFITINALEMARDDLMPLIGSELAISQGRITEGQGMELTKNVMSLFQTLLSRNLSGALVQMQQLQNHLISSDTLAILNGDIKHYLNEVNQAQNIQNRVETLATDQISLDVDFNLTEKSPLENGSSDSTSQKKLKK